MKWFATRGLKSTEAFAGTDAPASGMPPIDWDSIKTSSAPFMQYSTCSAADILHPQYVEIMRALAIRPVAHRKLWEFAYIVHHLRQHNMLREGMRGLVFGVGSEDLPSYFAACGCDILATDAPPAHAAEKGWAKFNEYSDSREKLFRPHLVDRHIFDSRVDYDICDMRDISPKLKQFDFCWSACAFEHLGSIRAGMDFVINSVEQTLKPGGIAVHTTEFNLGSNFRTLSKGDTVIYRRRDIERLVSELRRRGHTVDNFSIAPDAHILDRYIDVPPYTHNPHLRLQLGRYITTSVGIVVKKRGT